MILIILKVLFVMTSIVLTGIVLLQEGKGGGLGGAFGGVGGQAFGHGAGGINKFTGVIAGVFMVLAVAIGLVA